MNTDRQQAIHMIVDLINKALEGDGFPLAHLSSDGRHKIVTEIEDITMELLDTLPMPVPNKYVIDYINKPINWECPNCGAANSSHPLAVTCPTCHQCQTTYSDMYELLPYIERHL